MPEERSLAGEVTDLPPAPPAAASPLGSPNPAPTAPTPEPPPVSIVDTILNLDELLSADVRRAEKTARFCTKPWLEADIDELAYELDALTDARATRSKARRAGRPATVALRIQTMQAEYGAAFVSVRMGQLTSDDWQAVPGHVARGARPGVRRTRTTSTTP